MAGLMSRTSTVVKAWISKLLDRAEDPSVTLDYSYEKQLEMLQNVKRGVADVVTAKKRLELQTQKLEQELPKLDQQARAALSAGREDLARAALERKTVAQTELQGLDHRSPASRLSREAPREREAPLRQGRVLPQREGGHQAQYSAAEPSADHGSRTGIVEEMADTASHPARPGQTEQMQARAAAVDELVEAGALEDFTSGETSLDRELAQISAQSQVDDELAKLKGELAAGGAKKELDQ